MLVLSDEGGLLKRNDACRRRVWFRGCLLPRKVGRER